MSLREQLEKVVAGVLKEADNVPVTRALDVQEIAQGLYLLDQIVRTSESIKACEKITERLARLPEPKLLTDVKKN